MNISKGNIQNHIWENYKNNNILNKYMKLVRIEK